jgi:hypothetical protein
VAEAFHYLRSVGVSARKIGSFRFGLREESGDQEKLWNGGRPGPHPESLTSTTYGDTASLLIARYPGVRVITVPNGHGPWVHNPAAF